MSRRFESRPQTADTVQKSDPRRVLLGIGGGIAAYKGPELVRALTARGFEVRCALTAAALEFVAPLALQTMSGHGVRVALFDREEEGQIDHIRLADEADLVVVAPATADLLAKMAGGHADDLLTTLLLATRAPVLVAPAMNVNMWDHPATQANVELLRERGVSFVGPDAGYLACGWEGAGRMSDPAVIAERVEALLAPRTLAGETVLITAGGTREPLDPVRALTNRSSGKMGFAIAAAAARRGAEVVLVAGPTPLPTPDGVKRVDVETALEMHEAVATELASATVFVGAAAVADFRPERRAAHKIKKESLGGSAGDGSLELRLVPNPDILAEVGARSRAEGGARVVVGFAAESRDLRAAARRKLSQKQCDLVVANDISRAEAGFESDSNAVVFVWPDRDDEVLELAPKPAIAGELLDRIEALRRERRR